MRYFKQTLALFLLVTGFLNSLSVKFTDSLKSENTAGNIVPFNQPFLVCWGTFLGQMLCMFFYLFFVVKEEGKEKEIVYVRLRGINIFMAY